MRLNKKHIKVIGLTGGIASGKSSVSKILESLGAKIIDADKIARSLVVKDLPAWIKFKNSFGDGFLLPDGEIDRKKLGEAVFADEVLRKKLDDLMFPCILSELTKRIESIRRKSDTDVVVIDAALLIEAGWHELTDEVWLVKVDPDVQRERLMKRDNLTGLQARQRIGSQMSQDEKIAIACKVIDNSSDFSKTEKQVKKLWKEIGQISIK